MHRRGVIRSAAATLEDDMSKSAAQTILIDVGPGELIDKITILAIKSERMRDEAKLKNVRHELAVLDAARVKHIPASAELTRLEAALKKVNEDLWVIEDDIRQCEADKNFGQTFIDLARSVYIENDKRAALKKDINLLTGSTIIEEKSYTEFN
tara:strand:+ start:76 stop:534 length:459 start_codon:yes stop_codon:yes gene_type:complete